MVKRKEKFRDRREAWAEETASSVKYFRPPSFEFSSGSAQPHSAAVRRCADELLTTSAANGLSAAEVGQTAIPESFSDVEGASYELVRTVSHLYSNYEKQVLVIRSDDSDQ